MSTEFFNDQWRIPSNENQNKVSNYSMSFDGTNQGINLGTNFPYPSTVTDAWSVSFWIKLGQNTPYGYVFSAYDVSATTGFFVIIRGSSPARSIQALVRGSTASNYSAVKTNNSLGPNEWKHVVVTYNGNSSSPYTAFSIYFNSNPQGLSPFGTSTQSGSVINSSIKYIGQREDNSNYLTDCDLDQVTVFDYKLSATEVSTLYGGGTAITNPMSLSPKPIYYAQLGDQSVDNGANYLVPNNSLSDFVFNFPVTNYNPLAGKIFLNNQAQVFNNATNFSFSGWFKINIHRNQNIFEIKDGSNYRFNINYYWGSNGALRFNVDTSGAGNYADAQNLISGGKIAIGEWFHYAGVFNGSGATNADRTKLYINGQEQTLNFGGTQATSLGAIGATNTISLGNPLSNVFIQFGGQASNIQMWDASLSSPEVTTLYNNGSPYTGTQPQSSNLRFWYKLNAADTFDGTDWTIKDYAGGNNDGTSSGMTSANLVTSTLQQTNGFSPYALSFDGIDDYLDANRTVASNLDFSVSAWINPTSHGTVILGTRGLASAGTSNGITMNINSSGNLWARIFTETSNVFNLQTGGVIALNSWSHVAMTYDSSTKTLKSYLNGTEAGSMVGADPSVASTADLNIGRASIGAGGPHAYFNGKLSNVALWNTNLTPTEVTEIYNQGRPSNLNTFSGTAPVAWWQLGSNSSFNTNWTCLDEIGTNNAVSAGSMTNDDIVDGVGYSASGLGTSSIDIKGDAPYSTANGLSENMDVLDRTTDVPS